MGVKARIGTRFNFPKLEENQRVLKLKHVDKINTK